VNSFWETLNPSSLLFPALSGSLLLGLVCPLVGAYLVLRRTVFLGLTLPQIAAAGLAFAMWAGQSGFVAPLQAARPLAWLGSLLFTLLGMALLGWLERRGKGVAEGRLAVAYSFAAALTILFLVFNPVGEIEILSLLKGEVLALSRTEVAVLFAVYAIVLAGMLAFRREFLLSSFDRDLAFLLKGQAVYWDVLLYVLAGITIAVGVIMAGPLMLFGFLVLPPLIARPLVTGMSAFLIVSSLVGAAIAFCGFYLSFRLDLPLGPTDVAFGCALVFLASALGALLRRWRTGWLAPLLLIFPGCAPAVSTFPAPATFSGETVWLFRVGNATGLELRVPAANPLESLAEIAGKGSPEARPTVMDWLRDSLRDELQKRGVSVAYPEDRDSRLGFSPSLPQPALEAARAARLSGFVLVGVIERWEPGEKLVRALVDFKLLRLQDGAPVWQARVRRALPTPGATHTAQAYRDAVAPLARDLFAR
jgi:ABC-type Mn2+/Zn2+ transport system permease subunit